MADALAVDNRQRAGRAQPPNAGKWPQTVPDQLLLDDFSRNPTSFLVAIMAFFGYVKFIRQQLGLGAPLHAGRRGNPNE
jgi:hypothetical protein